VQVAFGEPIPATELPSTPEAAGQLVEDRLWPEVEGEYRRLRSRPGVIAAGLAAVGLGGGLLVQQQRRRAAAAKRSPLKRLRRR
jgi:1-acyl-sn-glycerol-3-phosphate acyltransferase